MFEGWSNNKLLEYNIKPDYYDHKNVDAKPAILINSYTNQRVPYLTDIHLWDVPLMIGSCDLGMVHNNSRVSLYTSRSVSIKKSKPGIEKNSEGLSLRTTIVGTLRNKEAAVNEIKPTDLLLESQLL